MAVDYTDLVKYPDVKWMEWNDVRFVVLAPRFSACSGDRPSHVLKIKFGPWRLQHLLHPLPGGNDELDASRELSDKPDACQIFIISALFRERLPTTFLTTARRVLTTGL